MGIKFIKDYQFEDEKSMTKDAHVEEADSLQILSGEYQLVFAYKLRWILHVSDDTIEITFIKKYDGTSETKILNKEDPNTGFADYWRPYNRIVVSVKALFDERKLILNGKGCTRREVYSGWSCIDFGDVVVTSW
jgi:hypothetical protein